MIESVLAQVHGAWELVISDNASDEDLASIASRYGDPRIRHVRWMEHVGTYENHNRAIALSRYDWVVPIGSDDRMAAECLAAMAERIEKLAADGTRPSMVIAGCTRVDADGNPADRRYYGSQGVKTVVDGLYQAHEWVEIMTRRGAPPWNIGSIAFSAQAVVNAGAFRPEIGLSADNELVFRLAAYGPVAFVDRPLAEFTVRADSDGNRRFFENRSSGDPQTPMGAALRSGLAALEAQGLTGRRERKLVARTIARLHLQRAGQHRILPGGRGRRGAVMDVGRAIRAWPGMLTSPSEAVRAAAAVLAPGWMIRRASARIARNVPG